MAARVMLAMDTHRIVAPERRGFTDFKAETVTDILAETRVADLTHLATKADLIPVATKADVAELETKIIKWLVPLPSRPDRADRSPYQDPSLDGRTDPGRKGSKAPERP
jgi:hypothetical protein